MFKWVKAGALAVMLALPWAMPVGAEVVTNTTDQLLNAADETTSTLTVGPFVEMTMFISGTYSTANVVVLQKEVGSPGSGAFETVLTLETGTADTRTTASFVNGPNTNGYRLKMTTFGTGAVVAYLTDWATTPRNYFDGSQFATHIVLVDDFQESDDDNSSATVVNDELYEAVGGTDNSGAIAILDESNREGGIIQVVSTDENDQECFGNSLIANHGALVSEGTTVFEVRYQVGTLTAGHGMQIGDQQCSASAVNFTVVGTTVTAVANFDGAGFFMNDAATATTSVMAVSAIAAVEGANALPVPVATTAVSTYNIYRIEIDSSGNAYWYYDGALVHAEPLAVGTGTEVSWSVIVESSSAGSAAMTQTIDYILWAIPRPSSAST